MLFSLPYRIRSFLFRQSFITFIFDLKHAIFCLVSFLRGCFLFISGRLIFLKSFEYSLIGRKVKFQLEEKAKILLINSRSSILHKELLPKPFPTGTKIGHHSYWRFVNIAQYNVTQIKLKKNSTLALHSNTTICPGAYIFVNEGKTLEIKTNTYISANASIMTYCGLIIGENVLVAHNVTIMDFDGHPIFKIQTQSTTLNNPKRIIIEDNVWIGMNATILKGVRIGNGAIIAANSLVTKDVPANTIVAGNPARIILENVSWKNF